MTNRLKELRKEKGYTLNDIAQATGITRGTYNNYENEKTEPKLATWQKLADFFDVDIAYIQGFSDIKTHEDAKVALVNAVRSDGEAWVNSKYSIVDKMIVQHAKSYDSLFEKGLKITNNPEADYEKFNAMQKRRIAYILEGLLDTPAMINNSAPNDDVDRFIDVMFTALQNWYEPEQPALCDNVTGYQDRYIENDK